MSQPNRRQQNVTPVSRPSLNDLMNDKAWDDFLQYLADTGNFSRYNAEAEYRDRALQQHQERRGAPAETHAHHSAARQRPGRQGSGSVARRASSSSHRARPDQPGSSRQVPYPSSPPTHTDAPPTMPVRARNVSQVIGQLRRAIADAVGDETEESHLSAEVAHVMNTIWSKKDDSNTMQHAKATDIYKAMSAGRPSDQAQAHTDSSTAAPTKKQTYERPGDKRKSAAHDEDQDREAGRVIETYFDRRPAGQHVAKDSEFRSPMVRCTSTDQHKKPKIAPPKVDQRPIAELEQELVETVYKQMVNAVANSVVAFGRFRDPTVTCPSLAEGGPNPQDSLKPEDVARVFEVAMVEAKNVTADSMLQLTSAVHTLLSIVHIEHKPALTHVQQHTLARCRAQSSERLQRLVNHPEFVRPEMPTTTPEPAQQAGAQQSGNDDGDEDARQADPLVMDQGGDATSPIHE